MSMNGLSLALLISSSSSLLLAFSRFLIIANTKSKTATIHIIMVSKLFIIQTLYRWYGKSIDKFSTSSLVTRLTTDVANLQNAYQMVIRIAFRSPSIFLFSLIMAFSVNYKLALIYVAVIPILAIGLWFIMGTQFSNAPLKSMTDLIMLCRKI